MRESYFTSRLMKKLKADPRCQFATRIESGAVCPGIPDIYLIWNHRHLWLEAKTETGLRQSQKIWHEDYRRAGGYVGVIRPTDDLETVIYEILNGGIVR